MSPEQFADTSTLGSLLLDGKLLECRHYVTDLCAPNIYHIMPQTNGSLPWLHVRITWGASDLSNPVTAVHRVLNCLGLMAVDHLSLVILICSPGRGPLIQTVVRFLC